MQTRQVSPAEAIASGKTEKKFNQLLDSGTEVAVEHLHEMDLLLVCQDELSRFVADIDRHKGHTWCSFVFTEIPSSPKPDGRF